MGGSPGLTVTKVLVAVNVAIFLLGLIPGASAAG